ncbi:MAG: prolyl oligopeptidase family serine peptidase [Intrasporangiaceae bacterium]|nr:prolyl oligopeptidase family serine peptidase [Intrasporangiaceae bacterium]
MGFPRQLARTRRFTLGLPRAATVASDGRRVAYLRTATGEDPVTSLWEVVLHDDGTATEQRLVDAGSLTPEDENLPDAERARRERAREQAVGITSYAADRALHLFAFALGGVLFTHDRPTGTTVAHPSAGPVFDPRPSPDGSRIAYLSGDGLHILELPAGPTQPGITRPLLIEERVSWGRAEFVAAEEMRRTRGYWWAPDGERLAVTRVDESDVATWHIADPAAPWTAPREHRYPAAGTTDADVRLAVVSLQDGRRVDVAWDRQQLPYLTRVAWDTDPEGADRLTLQVQRRDQATVEVRRADPVSGRTQVLRTITDDAWVELVPGSPAWSGAGLVTVEDLDTHGEVGSRTLVVDGRPVTPPGFQVRSIVGGDGDGLYLTASSDDPTVIHLHRWNTQGLTALTGPEPAVVGATVAAGVRVVTTSSLGRARPQVRVHWTTPTGEATHDLEVVTQLPSVTARPRFLELGERRLRAALLLPSDDDGSSRLPVLLDPYGGPHAQRVVASHGAYVTPQWIADQGFAVLVVDGRGSPGRGPRWERAIHGDLATIPLTDQRDAVVAAAELEPRLDLGRVGIRGWSFGGYLAALAVLRAPDLFRAAIAGAPVTDWRLYDTHYTERYLGIPAAAPEAYEVSSLVDADAGLGPAALWTGEQIPELLVIHGLADDNVVAAHALRLSSALLADGRPHRFLPLSGVTHMTPQEVVAERLLDLQVGFLRQVLGGPVPA